MITHNKLINTTHIHHQLINDVVKYLENNYAYNITSNTNKANLIIYDKIMHDDVNVLINQRITKFTQSYMICCKYNTFSILNKYREIYPLKYDFYPETWLYPDELNMIEYNLQHKNKFYIFKHGAGSLGKQVFLIKSIDELKKITNKYKSKYHIIQEYIHNPLLIDGYKFDLRLYIFVNRIKPLEMYLYKDGLIRLCSEKYIEPNEENCNNQYVHITNTAVNIHKDKRNHDIIKLLSNSDIYDLVWNDIKIVCYRTFVSIMNELKKYKKTNKENNCQIFGIDIMFDNKYNPYVLEINDRPCMDYITLYEYDLKFDMYETFIRKALNNIKDDEFYSSWDVLTNDLM